MIVWRALGRSSRFRREDPADPAAMVESAYPWTTENGTDTVLHLKNTTDKSVSALAIFVFPGGGGYSPDRIVLEPHQSAAIDIQKLKDTKKRDVQNQVFPANEGHGLLFWHQEIPATMIGRAEQTNVKEGIARSFSCISACCDNFSFGEYILGPSSLTGAVGDSGSLQGHESYTNCSGETYPNSNYPLGYPVSPQHGWDTSDSAVATVSSGNVSYVGAGTATITANFTYPEYDYEVSCVVGATWPDSETAPVAVDSVTLTDEDLENDYVKLTLAGPVSGTLDITAYGGSSIFLDETESALGPGDYSESFDRTLMSPDTYTSVTGAWNVGGEPSQAVNLSRTWWVQGLVRHTQYNVPSENYCSGSDQDAWIFDHSCNFTQVQLKSDFVTQTYENGTGSSMSYGLLQYNNGSLCSGLYPSGANTQNAFLEVSSVTGSCGTTLTAGDSVATNPNPAQAGNPYVCGDNILYVTSSNTNQTIKHAADYCPDCANTMTFNGTNGHIDDYTSSSACGAHSVGDYGNYYTADTH